MGIDDRSTPESWFMRTRYFATLTITLQGQSILQPLRLQS